MQGREQISSIQSAQVHLIGAPTDIGAGVRGASMGPEALRVAGLAQALVDLGLGVQDRLNIEGPANPESQPEAGYRHLDGVTEWCARLGAQVERSLQEGGLPMVLGGDHALAIGSIGAVLRQCRAQNKRLRIVWLDAHADCNTAELTPSGNIHGMPVACLFGLGPAQLLGQSRLLPHEICQIGIRSVDAGEKQLVHTLGYEVFDMRYIDEFGMRHTMQQALQGVDSNTHLHVSLDIDFLDPDIAPGVGTPVRGGPSYREAQLCMEMIADTGSLASLDIMELNPARDVHNQTAQLSVDLVSSLFGKSTLMRQRPGPVAAA